MEDLTQMIKGYDFSHVFDETVDSATEHVLTYQASTKPTVQQLLTQLQEALTEQTEEMWPETAVTESVGWFSQKSSKTEAEKQVFKHFNVEFDMDAGTIGVETAARDYSGKPLYEYVLDTKSDNSVQLESTVPSTIIKPQPALPEKAVQPVAVAPVSVPEATPVVEEVTAEHRPLTLEEQRAVAMQVVSFFFFLIAASFVGLYIYHKIEQKSLPQGAKKTSL
jgi:hypothetical protein